MRTKYAKQSCAKWAQEVAHANFLLKFHSLMLSKHLQKYSPLPVLSEHLSPRIYRTKLKRCTFQSIIRVIIPASSEEVP